jgi:hypothetical protein
MDHDFLTVFIRLDYRITPTEIRLNPMGISTGVSGQIAIRFTSMSNGLLSRKRSFL